MELSSPRDERFTPSRLVRATGTTLVAALVAVIAIRAITGVLVDVPEVFGPLRLSNIIILTVIGVLGAAGTCLALQRLSRRPVRLFRQIVPVGLALSLIPDVVIWVNGDYDGTATASTVIPVMLMHVAVALSCMTLLPALGRERAPIAVGVAAS